VGSENKFKDAKEKRPAGGFVPFPYVVLRGQSFARLSANAIKLLVCLMAQYRGKNNGDLSIAWKLMKYRGWKSEETLNRAKEELLMTEFIAVTRRGARPNKAALYGITFFALDEHPKLEVTAHGFPRGAWDKDKLSIIDTKKVKNLTRVTDAKNTALTTKIGVVKAA
jgi:hypothetical protein